MKEIKELFIRYVNNECTEAEIKFLLQHIGEAKNEVMLKEIISGILAESDDVTLQEPKDLDGRMANIYSRIKYNIDEGEQSEIQKSNPNRWYLSAAAAILVLLACGLYFIKVQQPSSVLAGKQVEKIMTKQVDIEPGGNRAVLTLANGKKIVLDRAQDGILSYENEVEISKTKNGELIYALVDAPKGDTESEINTISIPRGGEYQITLADGTRVWLNAASSLSFPSSFQGKERKVELTGEAYFEVAKDKAHPFIVKTLKQEVEVLGTHFNINSYADEPSVNTTLLEGSVRVRISSKENVTTENIILKPGQKSTIVNNRIIVSPADTEEAIAWKNSQFIFNNESLESIMRKISRWYNVDVEFEDEELKKLIFWGSVSRFENSGEVLKMLEVTGEAGFKIKGTKVFVFKK